MKILFFFANNCNFNMFMKIQAELLTEHSIKGDVVYVVKDFRGNIGKSQLFYGNVLYHNKKSFEKLIKKLESKNTNIKILNYKKINNFKKKDFKDIQELKTYKIDGYNLGTCVASSVITIVRDHKLDTKKYKNIINKELKVSLDVLNTIQFYNETLKPDLVYVFNGRLAAFAPIVLFCQKNKVNFKTFETTYSFDRYHIIDNNIPHNIEYRYKEIDDCWNNSTISIEDKRKKGSTFFKNQRSGINEMDPSYISLQKKEIDDNLIKGKEVISFFNSSIDEFASVPGWENYIYLFEDETKAIEEICNHYVEDKNKIFFLRIHPNLKYLDNSQNRELLKLKTLKNLIIIEATSPIRSYSLLDKSNKIITFGSTIGVEGCYYGKPVICLGLSFYEQLDVAYIPKSKDELYSYLDDKNLLPKPKENALIYGFWTKTFGKPFTNFINQEISEKDYTLTSLEKQIGFISKFKNINFYKRFFEIFNPKYKLRERLKDPIYRKNILNSLTNTFRLFIPRKIK